jgi:hypothetical protein
MNDKIKVEHAGVLFIVDSANYMPKYHHLIPFLERQ